MVTMHALLDIFYRQNPEFSNNRPDPAGEEKEVKGVLLLPLDPERMQEGYLYVGTAKQAAGLPDEKKNEWVIAVSETDDADYANTLVTDMDAGYVLNAFCIAFQTLFSWERDMDIELAKGSPLQQLLNVSEDMIEPAVVVYDPSMKLLGYINEKSKNDQFHETIAKHGYLSRDIFSSMSDRHKFENLKENGETMIYANEQPPGTYTLIKYIASSQVPLGYVFAIHERLEEIDHYRGVLHMLCQKIQISLKGMAPLSQRQNYLYEYFLTDILNGDLTDPEDISIRFHYLGIPKGTRYVLLNLRFSKDADIPLGYFSDIVSSVLKTSYLFHFRGKAYVIMHLQKEDSYSEREEKLQIIEPIMRQFDSVAIASACFEKLEQLPDARTQTDLMEQLFDRHLVKPLSGNVLKSEECRAQRILEICLENEGLDFWIQPALQRMLEDDARRNIKYIDFLTTFLKERLNVSKTAEKLCMHRSNVTYHLGKIKERYGLELEDGDQWIDILGDLIMIEFSRALDKES